jgi:hypothetical protein
MKVTGGCHCGHITYEAEVDPATVKVCHCTDCQKLTGTAFRATVASLPETFRLMSGTPKIYIKTAESGVWVSMPKTCCSTANGFASWSPCADLSDELRLQWNRLALASGPTARRSKRIAHLWLGRQSECGCAAPRRSHLPAMKKSRRKTPAVLPLMMTELAIASWQTIAHRSLIIAGGRCSPAEYSRMVLEKMSAATRSASVLARSRQALSWTAMLAPWHVRAKSNARRLRRKRPIG